MGKSSSPAPLRPRSLVTGGGGFVGSHLCDRLLAEGHRVICVDSQITSSGQNLEHLQGHPDFLFIQHDVSESLDFDQLYEKAQDSSGSDILRINELDYVLHLASPASPKDYARYPIQTLKVGSHGTYHALELAKATGSTFLITSTSEVYGDPMVSPQVESYWGNVNPIGPRSVYDEAKRYAEALTMAYHREHGVRIRIARLFNTYGERMRVEDGRALPNFMVQALLGKPLTLYGDGSQTRSLCHVSDMVEGLYRLLLSQEEGPINLGNPEEVSMRQLAQEVIEYTGSKSAIVSEPLPPDDPKRRWPDISKAKTLLGWRPQVSRAEGIKSVIPYFRNQAEALCAR